MTRREKTALKRRKRMRRAQGTDAGNRSPNPHSANSDAIKIEAALTLQKAGQLDDAKQIYCEILGRDPSNSDAWHLLGMALYTAGAYTNALECLNKAGQIAGHPVELTRNLALVHHALGNDGLAIEMLGQIVDADPEDVNSRNNYGVLLLEDGQFELAEQQFHQVLERDPGFQQSEMNLANCWVKQNRLHDAERVYQDLLRRFPNHLDVMGNLGECYRRQSRWDEAVDVLRQVVIARPNDLVSRLTHARTLVNLARFNEAAKEFKAIILQFPNCGKAYHYLGTTLQNLGDLLGAENAIRKTLEFDPGDPQALCSLGFLCIETDRRTEAVDCFAGAIRLDPRMSEAHSCLLYLLSGDPTVSPEKLFAEHVLWGQRFGNVQPLGRHKNTPEPNRRLKIGYTSADFCEHAVSVFFEPLLRLCDSSRFETFCYYESRIGDHVTEHLKSLSDHWRVTHGYSDQQVAQQISDDKIDILIDLAGHTYGNRLTALAYRPAPLQISWLGYPNTTGLPAIDYCLTCEVQNPVEEASLHTEQLIRIPGGSFCFSPPTNAPPVSELPALRSGQITLGSLHRPFKISSATQDLWAAALHALPNARLLAFNTRFNDTLAAELKQALIKRGIADDRIEVRSSFQGGSYLKTYDEIDIGLDATPWAGGTTTMEALWMGIPVIAFYGNNRPSRGTAGIVHHLGKPEWIARSTEQYAEKIAVLATDLQSLSSLRRDLRNLTRQTIADEQRFVSELETAYQQIWQRWCDSVASSK